jgi:hypothetical protein
VRSAVRRDQAAQVPELGRVVALSPTRRRALLREPGRRAELGSYDPNTTTFFKVAEYSRDNAGLINALVTVLDNTFKVPIAYAAVYNFAEDRWTPVPASGAPTARGAMAAYHARGKTVIWGGAKTSTGSYEHFPPNVTVSVTGLLISTT